MSEQLFQEVSDPSVRVGSRKWYTVPLSITVHALMLGLLVVVPLMATNALPTPQSVLAFVSAPVPPPPPPPPPVPKDIHLPTEAPSNPALAPTNPPEGFHPEPPPQLPHIVNIQPDRFADGPGVILTPPPPVPTPPVEIPRVGGKIKTPVKLKDVMPIYPAVARAAKISGLVIIEATINQKGEVEDAKVLRSVPMLDAAALEAVKGWKYAPSTLNGDPTAVLMTVTVNFALN